MLLRHVGLMNLIFILSLLADRQRRKMCFVISIKKKSSGLCVDILQIDYIFRHSMIIDTTALRFPIPVRMTLASIQDDCFMRQKSTNIFSQLSWFICMKVSVLALPVEVHANLILRHYYSRGKLCLGDSFLYKRYL